MPPAKIVAMATLAMDIVLQSSFLYVVFTPRALSFSQRARRLRFSFLGGLLLAFFLMLFWSAANLLPVALGVNALLILTTACLLAMKIPASRRHLDPHWLQQYIKRLEKEMHERRAV